MRDTDSKRVFVVALGNRMEADWPLNNIQMVEDYDRYFFPASRKNWPKVPPNYVAFRYWGRLQSIRHVDGYVIDTDMSRHLPASPRWSGTLTSCCPWVLPSVPTTRSRPDARSSDLPEVG